MSEVSIINLPDFGEFEDVEVIEICAKEGQKVDSEDPVVVLETDKAAMEIPASVKGTIKKGPSETFNLARVDPKSLFLITVSPLSRS